MKPTRFFHTSERQYTKAHVDHFVQTYGQDILIGGDEGWEEDFDAAMDAVVEAGAWMHVYTMGPGMYEWSREERAQIKRAARSVGIDTNAPEWKKTWYGAGWFEVTLEKIRRYDHLGFYSIEIDNLDAVFSAPQGWIGFYKTFQALREKEDLDIRIMIKNLGHDTLKQLVQDVEEDYLDRDIFAAFGMFEAGSGQPHTQILDCARIGIQAVTPINGLQDTKHYGTAFSGVPYEVM